MRSSLRGASSGFSLVEMLTVVAVIGIVASISLPHIGGIYDTTGDLKNRSNAQRIVSLYHSGSAMGIDFNGANMEDTIENVVTGAPVPKGAYAGTYYGLPGLSTRDQSMASRYIRVEGGALQYLGSNVEEP